MKQRAFTLIELLVVVSIIALLIGILLPALGAVRQQARITLCLNNQKQHSIGVLNYAAANGDTLLNAPRSQATAAAAVSAIGRRGLPSFSFAGEENPLAGFEIPGSGSNVGNATAGYGIPTMVAPLHIGAVLYDGGDVSGGTGTNKIGPRFAENASIYNHYWIPLSTYMVEGSRLQVLQDVFISASDPGEIRESWDIAREEFTGTGAMSYNPTTDLAGGDVEMLAPSYRYVPAAYTDSQMWTYVASNTGNPPPAVDPDGQALIENQTTAWSIDDWEEYGKVHQIANISFPSKKVLFFLQEAVHNPKVSLWVENGAVSTLAMADGSATSKIAARDGLDPDYKDSAGPWRPSDDQPVLELSNPSDPSGGGTFSRDAHFLTTLGGLTGRDF